MKTKSPGLRLAGRTSLLLGIATALLAAGFAIWIPLHPKTGMPNNGSTNSGERGLTQTRSSDNAQQRALSFNWVKGSHVTYQYRLEALTRTEGVASGSQQQPSASYLTSARMHLQVIDSNAKGPMVGFLLQDAQIFKAGVRMMKLEQLACSVPCVVQMDPRGRILSMDFPNQLSQEDKSSLAGLYGTQIVLPDNPGASQWKTAEEDMYGIWKCNYTLAKTDLGTIRKNRSAEATKGSPITIEVRQSDVQCKLGAIWLQELKSEESLAFLYQGQLLSLVTVKLSLEQTASPDQLPPPLAALKLDSNQKGLEFATLRQALPGAEGSSSFDKDEQARLREKLKDVTCAQSVQNLANAVASAKSHSDTVQAIHGLRDMIRAYPERAAQLAAMIPGAASNPELTARMIHALELAGALPEAQEALAQLLSGGEQTPKTILEQAAVAAGGVGEIKSQNLLEALFRTAQHQDIEISDAASFAVGALAATNTNLQQTVLDSYTPALVPNNPDTDDVRVALRVLYNSGLSSPQIIADSIRLSQQGQSETVRSAAVDYLGRVNPEHPEDIIPALSDPGESVRIAAAYSLTSTSRTTAEAVSAVAQLLRNPDTSPALRAAAVSSLAAHAQSFPAARNALQIMQAASNTPPELREQIFAALSDPTKTVFPDQLTKSEH